MRSTTDTLLKEIAGLMKRQNELLERLVAASEPLTFTTAAEPQESPHLLGFDPAKPGEPMTVIARRGGPVAQVGDPFEILARGEVPLQRGPEVVKLSQRDRGLLRNAAHPLVEPMGPDDR